jgi:hypothetical protein
VRALGGGVGGEELRFDGDISHGGKRRLADGGARRREFRRIARHEAHARTGRGGLPGQGQADAAGATGDEHVLSAEFHEVRN